MTESMSDGQWATLFLILGLSTFLFLFLVWIGWQSNKTLDKGELRRSIAAFIIVIFGLLVTASFFDAGPTLPPELQGLFAGAVTTILGFYFGARSASQPAASRPADPSPTPSPQPVPDGNGD